MNNTQLNQEDITEERISRWAFNIQQVIDTIKNAGENARVTFIHRFIYQEDDPRILLALHQKTARKLSFMGILPINTENEYDTAAVEYATNQFTRGNSKFYTKKDTTRNTETVDGNTL